MDPSSPGPHSASQSTPPFNLSNPSSGASRQSTPQLNNVVYPPQYYYSNFCGNGFGHGMWHLPQPTYVVNPYAVAATAHKRMRIDGSGVLPINYLGNIDPSSSSSSEVDKTNCVAGRVCAGKRKRDEIMDMDLDLDLKL
ncbi:hypothetical protein F0562_022445 [Nyssa sinensis]|uniref:Uncharacterized protein n=1 Tax=Nyssa sinensis TaxID=561372 RepID=A0A5J5BN53_9ASTE|nr:hypothetical protein F0562_022445 [Nyssa sinensis]